MGCVDHEQCRLRYRHICEFERMLADEGTTMVKVFLHLSKDEQRERLQARIDDPEKNWKFKTADLDVRKQWDDYQEAYEEVITRDLDRPRPWFVVPADRKWVRDVAVVDAPGRHVPAPRPADPAARPGAAGSRRGVIAAPWQRIQSTGRPTGRRSASTTMVASWRSSPAIPCP